MWSVIICGKQDFLNYKKVDFLMVEKLEFFTGVKPWF